MNWLVIIPALISISNHLTIQQVQAWDIDGHLAVGMTTMSGIKGTALTQLKRLLGGKDVVDTATWAHSVIREYPELSQLFYQTQDRDIENTKVNCSQFHPFANCPDGQCLTVAAEYFYLEMVKKGDHMGQTAAAATVSGSSESGHPGFRMPVALVLSDTDRMKFLTAVIAELHSPSRFGYKANNNGKNIGIEFPDSGDKLNKTTLFDYWESNLIQKTKRDRPSFWYSGWTHYNSLGRAYFESEQDKWNSGSLSDRINLIHSWAAETFKWSCEKIQRKSTLYNKGNDSVKPINEAALLINDGYRKSAHESFVDFEYVKNMLLLGGIRTSLVLNSILATREAKQLRLGSGVKVKLDADGHGSKTFWRVNDETDLMKWTRNFGINICIIGAVLGVFAIFVRYGSSSAGRHHVLSREERLKNGDGIGPSSSSTLSSSSSVQMKMKE